MQDIPLNDLKQDLKQLIIEATGKDIACAQIQNEVMLFGPDSPLQLDSLDGLQISMAIQRQYGVRIADPKELRRIMESIDTLADYIQRRL